jgi:hypothetical protein
MPDPAAPHEGADPDPADLTVRMAGYRVWGLQLAALTRALTGAVDLAEVADEVSTATRAALGSHFAGVALADPAAGTIRFVSMSDGLRLVAHAAELRDVAVVLLERRPRRRARPSRGR